MNKIILLFSLALLLSGCNRARQEQGQEDDDVTIDLPQLKAQGEITAVTLDIALLPFFSIRCIRGATNTN